MTEPDSGKGPDWSVIYVSHAPALYGRSRWALGGREPHALVGIDADDAVQETFTLVMERGMRYLGTKAQVATYLRRQLSWVLSDAYEEQNRRRGRQDLQQEVGDTGIEGRSSNDVPGPDPIGALIERLDDEETLRISEEHLRCLTPKQRLVWKECVREDRPTRDVAEELGVTSTRIRQLAAAAARKLRQCVANPSHE